MTAFPLSPSAPAPAPRRRERRDRRGHIRVDLRLAGRFLEENGDDHTLLTAEMSCNGAFVVSKHRPQMGAKLILYIDDLGRVPAHVTRRADLGFGVEFDISQHKRDKIADRMTWILNRDELGLTEEREAKRYPGGGPAMVKRESGLVIQCTVVDISLTGAAFSTEAATPFVGEVVLAGKLKGEVVRSGGGQFAVRYIHE